MVWMCGKIGGKNIVGSICLLKVVKWVQYKIWTNDPAQLQNLGRLKHAGLDLFIIDKSSYIYIFLTLLYLQHV